MAKSLYIIGLLLAAAMLYAPGVLAAPFCVQAQGIPPECYYDDASQCRKRAAELKGLCVANRAELAVTAFGAGKYCMVDSHRIVQCIYIDRASCDADAARHDAACIDAPVDAVQPDLYKQEPNRKY